MPTIADILVDASNVDKAALRTWLALGRSVNVKDYGAAGDGVTEDQAAFNAALAVITAGDQLIIPPGTYVINGDVTFPNGVRVRGASRDYTTIKFPAGTTAAFIFGSSTAGSKCRMTGLTFDGSLQTVTRIFAIKIGAAGQTSGNRPTDVEVDHCRFYRMSGDSFALRTGRNIRIHHNDFDTTGMGAGADTNDIEIMEHDVDGVWIHDNEGRATGGAGVTQGFIDVELTAAPAGGATDVQNIFIFNNKLSGYNLGVDMGSAAGAKTILLVLVKDNIFLSCDVCVVFGGNITSESIAIVGNICRSGGGHASFGGQIVVTTAATRVDILNNLCESSAADGIRCGATDSLIEGNHVYDPVNEGIELLDGINRVQIVSNFLRACATGIKFLGASTEAWVGGNTGSGNTANIDYGSSVVRGPSAGTLRFLSGSVAAGSTVYMAPAYGHGGSEVSQLIPLPIPCRAVRTDWLLSAAPAGAETSIQTLRKNGGDTAIAVTISAAATTGSKSNAMVVFAAGDTVSFKRVTSAGAAAAVSGGSLELLSEM